MASRDLGVRGLNLYWSARRTRAWRAVAWYMQSRGSILCGGLAYSALFSLFAALTIGYTVLTKVLGAHPDVIEAVFAEIDEILPGLIDTGSGKGIIKPADLVSDGPLSTGLSVASIVAAVVLVYTVVSFMSALRRSVRIMFGRRLDEENAVQVVLRELAAFLAILLAVVVSAVATVIESRFATVVFGWLDIRVSALVATVVGVAATVAINALVVAFVIRMLAGLHPKRSDLFAGCLAAGVAMAGLRYLGSSFVSASASRNALLASFATLVTILLLVNLTARVVLMACAWIADPPVTSRYGSPTPPDEWEIRRGWGSGWPWSPIVRGYRRGMYPRAPG